MGFFKRLTSKLRSGDIRRPRNEDSFVGDLNDPQIVDFLRGGMASAAGPVITPQSALKVATAYRCASIICGAIETLPIDLIRRLDANNRQDASDHPLWPILRKAPNSWQTPSEFKRLMMMCVLFRGNGYALIVRSRGKITMLLPLLGAMHVHQNPDLSVTYQYTSLLGARVDIKQSDIFHLRGPSLDGLTGMSVISYAKETLGLSIETERHASKLFRNGAAVRGTLSHPKSIPEPLRERLELTLDQFRGADGEKAFKDLILEGGMEYKTVGMNSVDAELIGVLQYTQYEIAMFFGVPPHMVGLTEKSTSFGTGIEQQGLGFITYTLQPHMTMWGEAIGRDLLGDDDPKIECRLNPAGLIRGDIKTRYAAYAVGRQWGWLCVNDIREKEDMNQVPNGDTFYEPINMQPMGTGLDSSDDEPGDSGNEKPTKSKNPKKPKGLWVLRFLPTEEDPEDPND